MKDPKKVAAKRLKRKRKLANRNRIIEQMKQSGRIIIFGGVMYKKKSSPKPKKVTPKKVKVLKPYLAVKLTAKLDALTLQIRNADPKDPKLAKMKERRDQLKARINQK